MASDIRKWTWVDQLKPIDTSNIQDKGMKGIAMLAVALGWNLQHRRGAPSQLKSREGMTRNLPTDTGVRQSVFWSMLASILSHSEGKLPTPRLIDEIAKVTGMSKAHAHTLAARVSLVERGGDDLPEEEEPVEVDMTGVIVLEEPMVTKTGRVLTDDDVQALADEAERGYDISITPFVPTERTEPTLNMASDGAQYISPIMDTVIRQLVANGDDQITYRCKQCGLEFETKRGVGAHWQRHVQAGEAEATNNKRKMIVNVIPDYEPTEVHTPKRHAVEELRRLRKIVRDVQLAVGQDALKEYEARAFAQQRRIDALQKERDDAIKRADRLASDLRSLRELIGGISDE